jgi:hypothetical protein
MYVALGGGPAFLTASLINFRGSFLVELLHGLGRAAHRRFKTYGTARFIQ